MSTATSAVGITDRIEVYSPDVRFHFILGIVVTGHVRILVRKRYGIRNRQPR